MDRAVPGMIEVEGREFFYLEVRPGEGFDEFFDEALSASVDLPMPDSGGAIEEKVRIFPDGRTTLLGVSYKGDLPGWRARLIAYCQAKSRQWGIVTQQRLSLSDGTELPLGECQATFDDESCGTRTRH